MSKKSRKRNKKILGILAAGLGAAALMKRRKASAADAVTGVVNPNAPKTDWITKKSDTGTNVVKNTGSNSNYLGRMKGGNPDDPTGEIGQKVRANFAQKNRYVNPNEQTLAAGNAYVPRIPRVHVGRGHKDGGRIGAKSGGRVTGIAKRGFGRALMKGKK
jgi:hypothetical protein